MTEIHREPHYIEKLEENLQHIQHLLENLALSSDEVHSQESSRIGRHNVAEVLPRQLYLIELQKKLNELHHSDLAFILAALPISQRMFVWNSISADQNGKILIDVSDAVRETLIAMMSHEELRDATEQLATGEIADLAPNLPQSVMREVFKSLTIEEREQLRAAMSYPQDTVGALMDFNIVTIRKDATIESVLRFLRRLDELPDHTDQLFVIDRDDAFQGVLPLDKLLVNEPEITVSALMNSSSLTLRPDDSARLTAQAFERYALSSLPVIDEDGKLMGRVSISTVINFIRTKTENAVLNLVGLHEQEDIFASVWKSAKNRWLWLSINLCITFFASRVIGNFEGSIEKYVALATLMPIVAGFAGYSGNQTNTIFIRSLALGQINAGNAHRLLIKELTLSLLNGAIWGGIAGGYAYLLYESIPLALVMTASMLLNLLMGTLFGMFIPLALQKLGRDPAVGSNLLLTAATSSGGFFIFLGLAAIFLTN